MNIDKKHLIKLITKFQDGKASDDEITILVNFYKYCQKTNDWPSEIPNKDFILNGILSNVQKKIANSNKKKVKIKYLQFSKILKYAAMVAILVGTGYFYQQGFFTNEPALIIPDDVITLQLENGNIVIINTDSSTQVVDAEGDIVGTQNGNQLVYNNGVVKELLEYNTVTVPYGKRFDVKLSDGTNIHLNAGTSLKYPVKFIKGVNRQVFLNGEAYFDVAKDANHAFIVNADEIKVRVLGTQFNISSYPEDNQVNTVLIEGAVSVYNKEEAYTSETVAMLKPGFKAAWEKSSNQLIIEKTDTEIYTAWMKGRLILDEVAFVDILKKLERQYNVSFINNNQSLKNRYFTARFDVEDIHLVMKNLSQYASFSYVFNDNQIIINP